MNTLKSVLLLTLALLVAANSYSNYQMLAHTQQAPAISHPARSGFVAASYEWEPVVERSGAGSVTRELMHGLRVNFSLAIFLVFTIVTSMKERTK